MSNIRGNFAKANVPNIINFLLALIHMDSYVYALKIVYTQRVYVVRIRENGERATRSHGKTTQSPILVTLVHLTM